MGKCFVGVVIVRETDKSDQAAKEKLSCPFDGIVIPEMELQTSPEKSIVETAVTDATGTDATLTETAIQPVKVAKQFEAGLFIGEVTAVNIKRGRNLYTVLYEDGDGEDMNDREYKEARALYEETKGISRKKVDTHTEIDEAEDEPLHSGGETEGSDFLPSDDELQQKRAKKRRKTLRSPEKEKEKTKRGKNSKEAEPKLRKRNKDIIDVDAVLQMDRRIT
jgi:hypothetical protein